MPGKPLMAIGCKRCQPPDGIERPIDIAFQPIFDVGTGQVRAYEALVRGPDGESAASVLSEVQDHEWHRFDQRVRMMAIEKAALLGLPQTTAALAININSKAVLEAKRCLGNTIAAAARAGIPRDRIVLEFSENARLDVLHAQDIVSVYREHGFRTALDDFGNGYAGLTTLADVPVDIVKLDKALVRGIDASPARQTIVASIVGMMATLDRSLVAEGVETLAELTTLRALGIEVMQGFYLGRPSLTELQCEPYGMVQLHRRSPAPPTPFRRRAGRRT